MAGFEVTQERGQRSFKNYHRKYKLLLLFILLKKKEIIKAPRASQFSRLLLSKAEVSMVTSLDSLIRETAPPLLLHHRDQASVNWSREKTNRRTG